MGLFTSLTKLFASKPKHGLPIVNVSKRFELLGRTGQGSMSRVWRARDNKLGRMVCLKILDREKTAKFDERWVKLKRPMEGAILQALKHRNVVQTFEYGLTTDKEQYIVMELIDGMGLNFLIETNSPHINGRRIEYLIQLADGLEHIHKHGFIHRDICPRNVMVNSEGVVKIIDFGLTIPNLPDFNKPGNRTGTPSHLAPEVIKRVTTDERVDLFAMGITAYEVFTGQLPWEKAPSQQTLHSHLNYAGRNPAELRPDLDQATVNLLMKSIEREPRNRFQSAGEFRDALKALPRQDY